MRILAVFLIFAAAVVASEATLTVLATSDMHGNIHPYDYLTGKPSVRGLAKISTLIQAERKTAPHALVVDCGDTIQGSQLESVYQAYISTGKFPLNLEPQKSLQQDPMMMAMNRIRFDAMAVGNHEYNYGLKNFDKARSEANFPWLSANTKSDPASGRKPLDAYVIRIVDGIKVAIAGITTAAVPIWEKPENYKGYSFADGRLAAEAAVRELRSLHSPDVILLLAHSGFEPDTDTAPPSSGPREHITHELAQIKGVDAIVFGHTHGQVGELRVGNVLLTQPKNWAMSLARIDFELESKPEGGYRVISKRSKIIPVTADVPPDPEILKLAAPYHEITERYLNTVVGHAQKSMEATTSRVEDSALIDAIHRVQMHYAKADVSFASSFNPRAAIPKGPITVRQIASLYLYDNELYALGGTGKMVKEALENAARYFNGCADASCTDKPLINKAVIGYNFDMAQGVTYDIDLTRPVGDRIQNLRYKGRPLDPLEKLRIAVNNYRAGGGNGYAMFKDADIVWRSYEGIRELILRYYSENQLAAESDHNWRVIPETARRALRTEARREQPPSK